MRRGFHENHSSEPGARMVGRSSASEVDESVCASSTQARLNPFERLDGIGGVILHALEGDDAIARRLDHLAKHLEAVGLAEPVFCELVLQQALGEVLQALLHLADAHRAQAALGKAVLDQQPGKEMRLARASAAMRALVAGGQARAPASRTDRWPVNPRTCQPSRLCAPVGDDDDALDDGDPDRIVRDAAMLVDDGLLPAHPGLGPEDRCGDRLRPVAGGLLEQALRPPLTLALMWPRSSSDR